jgi:signal transduction histidine kinase
MLSSSPPNSRYSPLGLIYVGTALLIVVLLAINVGLIVHLRESELADEGEQLARLSLVLAEEADRSFQSVDLVISSIAGRIEAEGVSDSASFQQKMAGQDLYLLLREKISGLPQLDAVIVVNNQGKAINTSRSWPIPEIDVSDRDYFRAMKEDPNLKSYISQPVRNRAAGTVTGTWTIYLAHRVSGAGGEFQGMILGAIKMQYFEDSYRAISPGLGGTIVISRLDGVMLARFPPSEGVGRVFSSSQRLMHGGIAGTARERSSLDGEMRIKAAHRLTNYPVFVIATRTERAALANWRGIAWLMSLGALGGAISIMVSGIVLGWQWKRQAALTDAAFGAMRIAKEAAEMADRAKSEFLTNMSHELRTPLNAVLGFSQVMVGETFGPLGNDRYRAYATDIYSSGSHLLEIINDVLDLSKAAAGKLELAEDWFDALDVVNSVCRLMRPRVDEAKLTLAVHMPPGSLIVYADERLLKQMLLNLFSNACKFTPPQGHIECSISVDAAGMRFAVTDTGIGIPASDLERVTEPFVQVDSSLTRAHVGTGLGLALVRAMAELHGGSLRLDSTMGSGTTAAVILPLSRVQPANTGIAPVKSSPTPEPVIA